MILVNIRDEHVGQLALPAIRTRRWDCASGLLARKIKVAHQMAGGLRNTLSKTRVSTQSQDLARQIKALKRGRLRAESSSDSAGKFWASARISFSAFGQAGL